MCAWTTSRAVSSPARIARARSVALRWVSCGEGAVMATGVANLAGSWWVAGRPGIGRGVQRSRNRDATAPGGGRVPADRPSSAALDADELRLGHDQLRVGLGVARR